MIKDTFEIEIATRLQQAEAPVPAGSWAAIKAGIKTPPPAPAANPISGSSFVVGLAAATIMLVSLVVYSGNQPTSTNSAEVITEVQPYAEQVKSPVTVVQKAEADSEEIAVEAQQENTTPALIDTVPVIAQEVIVPSPNTDEAPRESFIGKPIDSNGVSEINEQKAEKRKQKLLQQNEANKAATSSNQDVNSIVAAPKANIKADKLVGYAPLTVNFANKGEGEKLYWEFGYMAESDDAAPEVIFEEPGVYTVFLTAENSKGDLDEDFVEITVKEGSKFYVHNTFSPNGDGKNDTYKIEGALNIADFYMIISDENGNSVFESRDINRAWEYDQSVHGNNDAKYFVSYRAVGIDGKVYTEDRKPIYIRY